MRTVQNCITARFLVARQRLGGDVPEKKLSFKKCQNQFLAGGSPLIWAIPRRKGVFTTKMWKNSLLQKKGEVFHIKVGVDH